MIDDEKTIEEKSRAVLDFYKTAFVIDGEASFMSASEARRIMEGSNVNVIKMTDSKRGTFYLARIMPINS